MAECLLVRYVLADDNAPDAFAICIYFEVMVPFFTEMHSRYVEVNVIGRVATLRENSPTNNLLSVSLLRNLRR